MSRLGIFCLSLLLLALPAGAAKQKSKAPKAPNLEAVEVVARRAPGEIHFDGRVRNTGDKPLIGLILIFKLRNDDGGVVTEQRGELDQKVLDPGEEAVFRMGTRDAPRAVSVTIDATDNRRMDLEVGRNGPFPIE